MVHWYFFFVKWFRCKMRRPTGPFTALYTQTLPQRSTAPARGARRRRRHQGAAAAVALCVFRAVAAHCTLRGSASSSIQSRWSTDWLSERRATLPPRGATAGGGGGATAMLHYGLIFNSMAGIVTHLWYFLSFVITIHIIEAQTSLPNTYHMNCFDDFT